MNDYQPLTQLKKDVENKRIKKYQQIKQKSNAKYYELYLNKIIFIQKFWRNHLIRKGLVLQRLSFIEINKNASHREKNLLLKNKLQTLKKQSKDLQNIDPNQQSVIYKGQLEKQLKSSLKTIFQGADRYAKIKAVLKSQMMSYQQIVRENQGLKKCYRENSSQTENFKLKNAQLSEKIKALRNKIVDEKAEILFLKKKNNDILSIIPSY